jgi:hypothetical protein
MRIEKPIREKNKTYLDWIRIQSCVNCGKPGLNDAAHIGSGGLCRVCHTISPFSYHQLGSKEAFSRANGLNLDHEMFKMLTKYIEEKNKDFIPRSVYWYAIEALIHCVQKEKNKKQ